MIGFKYQMYGREQVADKAPKSLYWFTTMLLARSLVDVEDLRPHLSPALAELQTHHEIELKLLHDQGRAVGRVSLTSGAKGTSEAAEKKKAEELEAARVGRFWIGVGCLSVIYIGT
jgi:hypothetical protein